MSIVPQSNKQPYDRTGFPVRFASLPPARPLSILIAAGIMLISAAYMFRVSNRPEVLPREQHQEGPRVVWPTKRELAERIYHESLHQIVASKTRSMEQECDAFCAAEEAAAAIDQRPPQFPVLRDGVTVWQWVRKEYEHYPRNKDYQPAGHRPARARFSGPEQRSYGSDISSSKYPSARTINRIHPRNASAAIAAGPIVRKMPSSSSQETNGRNMPPPLTGNQRNEPMDN